MARIYILDFDPAGLACHEPRNIERIHLWLWMIKESIDGAAFIIPAIVDYEVRRSLVLAEAWSGIKRLDVLYSDHAVNVPPLPISDSAMRTAAKLWADARRRGDPTAYDHALDGDVILSAQAIDYCSDADDWQIITENVAHIARYVGERARSRRTTVDTWMKLNRSIIF